VLDVTSDLGIPTYVAIMHWMQNGQENIEFGSGAHFDRRIALLRSLTELTQFLSIGMMDGASGEKPTLDGVTPLRLEQYPFLIPSDKPVVPPARCSGFAIRRSRPPSRFCPPRKGSAGCGGGKAFPGPSSSPCCWIAESSSRSMPPATVSGRARATTTS
jgi:hypothetical protein